MAMLKNSMYFQESFSSGKKSVLSSYRGGKLAGQEVYKSKKRRSLLLLTICISQGGKDH